jgi:hypothetical protein
MDHEKVPSSIKSSCHGWFSCPNLPLCKDSISPHLGWPFTKTGQSSLPFCWPQSNIGAWVCCRCYMCTWQHETGVAGVSVNTVKVRYHYFYHYLAGNEEEKLWSTHTPKLGSPQSYPEDDRLRARTFLRLPSGWDRNIGREIIRKGGRQLG